MGGFFGGLLNGLGLTGLSDTAGVLTAFFGTITDYQMWRSLGWLLAGIVLIGAGLALLARNQIVPGFKSAVGS